MKDVGMQNERTALSWTRSVLAALVVCLIVAQVAIDIPILAIMLAVGALLASGVALRYVHERYRQAAAAISDGRPVADGRAPAAITALVVLLGLGGITLILGG